MSGNTGPGRPAYGIRVIDGDANPMTLTAPSFNGGIIVSAGGSFTVGADSVGMLIADGAGAAIANCMVTGRVDGQGRRDRHPGEFARDNGVTIGPGNTITGMSGAAIQPGGNASGIKVEGTRGVSIVSNLRVAGRDTGGARPYAPSA
ncbi:MAG: hypothetical protein MZV49_08920 [Rhodopseudomonas palustris]|nr:hypothetical protein [Rhodopseudomonas palustris]